MIQESWVNYLTEKELLFASNSVESVVRRTRTEFSSEKVSICSRKRSDSYY